MLELQLAQVAPDFFAEYLKLGVLGITAASAIFWAVKKDRELSTERAERLVDAKAAISLAITSTEALSKWTIAQEGQNKAIIDMARALEKFTK